MKTRLILGQDNLRELLLENESEITFNLLILKGWNLGFIP